MTKKLFLMILLMLMIILAAIPALVGAAAAPVTAGCVRVHYLRTDFSYDDWTLYVWGDGYTGETVTWTTSLNATGMDEYGPYWDVSYGSGELNFIVHKDDSTQYGSDRSFPGPASGKEVWVIQDDGNYYTTVDSALTAAGIRAVEAIPSGYTRIYYLRLDKTYDGWGLHAWTRSGDLEGVSWSHPLEITGYDQYGYAYWDVPSDLSGYIIHNGDTKDTGERVLDGANNENYVVSGDAANYTDRLTAFAKVTNQIVLAKLTALNKIEFTTLTAINEGTSISVINGEKTYEINRIDYSKAPVYAITLAESLKLATTYQLAVGNMSAAVMIDPDLLDSNFSYNGRLGAIYSPIATVFRLWAPLADDVRLLLFNNNSDFQPAVALSMALGKQGVWSCRVPGDLDGRLYQYQVIYGETSKQVLDPYAVSMAAFDSNGSDKVGKGVVVDLRKTNPKCWMGDRYVRLKNQEDAVIYEVHVRDLTIADPRIPEGKRGTYEGFIAKIPYLKRLGVTHVQLQPVLNWYYGNESDKAYESGMATDNCNYNWGYDPHNFFTPEGWYASNPADPYGRIRELKQLIQELHKVGIGVVLDVVYNHTALTGFFEDIVPFYYYRRAADGSFTSGSGCGNDTASEQAMFRKLMIDSATYWVKEYHIDGFRFDLMGLHDLTTMNHLAAACRRINPDIELHGEGWDLGTLPLHERYCKGGGSAGDYHRALLEVAHGISAFSDGMRDGLIQQSYQTPAIGGFVQNDTSYDRDNEAYVRRGIVGNLSDYTTDLSIDTQKYNCFCDDPEESVNYITCHDGLTINDKLKLSLPAVSRAEFIRRYKLQCAIIMTSQGKAFFQAGEELFRSKVATDASANQDYIAGGYCTNSHDASDDINKIDWFRFQSGDPETRDLHDFYAGMIKLRRNHLAFRMETAKMIQDKLSFINEDIDGLIAYRIRRDDGRDCWKDIMVIFNATSALQTVELPGVDLRKWQVAVDGDRVNQRGIRTYAITLKKGSITVPPVSAVVLHAPVHPAFHGKWDPSPMKL